MADIYSAEIEKQVLAGLIQNSGWFYNVDKFLSESDFFIESNQTIFLVIKNLLDNKESVDKIVVAQKIHDLGIKLEIDPFSYLRALNVFSITQEGFIQSVKELKKLTVRRDISSTALKVAAEMKNCRDSSYDQIISKAQGIFNNQINLFEINNEPVDLFAGVEEMVEFLGNNPEEDGLRVPYPKFQKMFGTWTKGDVYLVAAEFGVGKSTWINDFVRKVCTECNPTKKVRGLILDTELPTRQVQVRNIGALAGVSPYLVRTGKFRNNPETLSRVRAVWGRLKKLEGCIDHIYVASMSTNEITSLVKRWASKNLGNGIEGIIALDYLKIVERVDDSNREYQVIADKVNELSKLAKEIKCPILTAVQLNAQGQVALSQRISWYVSFQWILRRKTDEELQRFGYKYGNRVLENKKSREWGEDGYLIDKKLSYMNSKNEKVFVDNHLNFNFDGFDVREIGTYDEMINPQLKPVDEIEESGLL